MAPSPGSTGSVDLPDYDEKVDFQELAMQDPDFNVHLDARTGKVDWRDPKALQYNYIRWIHALIDTTSSTYNDRYDPSRQVRGLDIGVGASCIYPLLAVSTRENWYMHGTDIDPKNFDYASKNVDANALSEKIKLHFSSDGSAAAAAILPLDALGVDTLDFTMSNPPFYASADEMLASAKVKALPPSAICTGAEVEMICPGGDRGFVLRMVEESVALGGRVQWYTSMFGKLGSVYEVLARLKQIGVVNWAVAVLRSTTKTKRWAIAWSFGDLRPRNDVARSNEEHIPQALMPLPTAQTIHIPDRTLQVSADLLNATMSGLEISWNWDATTMTGVGTAASNVWSRAARRQLKRKRDGDDSNATASEPQKTADGKAQRDATGADSSKAEETKRAKEIALAFKVTLVKDGMDVRWLRGKDFVIFESFCGMLKRAMRPAAAQPRRGDAEEQQR
ncbi:hypothetical protein MBLNU459_g5104t2 [Dothideomycetes sp. NU459]